MRVLLLAISLLLAGSAYGQTTAPPQWSGPVDIHVNLGPPRQWKGPVFLNSYNGQGPPASTWTTVDLTQSPWNVPANTVAVQLSGILIITMGTQMVGTTNLGVIFRAPGDTSVSCSTAHYIGQAVETEGGNHGIRSTMATWVPVVDGKIEFCWTRSTGGNWPTYPSYGVNLSVQAYAAPRPQAVATY